MYERNRTETERERNEREQMLRSMDRERVRSEAIARQLRLEATNAWQKAITGMIALPTAVALSAAAWALTAAGFVERGFEVFQMSTENVMRGMDGLRRREGAEPYRQPESRPETQSPEVPRA